MHRGIRSIIGMLGTAALVAAGLAACSQQPGGQAEGPQSEEKRVALKPDKVEIKVSFLKGTLEDIRVTQVVEQGTGRVITEPVLHATLKLQNASEDQAARLIAGKVEYRDATGQPIRLAASRPETVFRFSSYQIDRLDPGMETSQSIDVPFPAAALKDRSLGDIQLELAYIPSAYREERVRVPVSLAQ